MKGSVFIAVFLFFSTVLAAQSKQERAVIERVYLLSHTVFGTKDSITLEDLFARKATYGHSNGKIETREEAIAVARQNKSVYRDTAVTNINVLLKDDVAVVRYLFKSNEHKPDGTVSPLNLNIMQVWVKEKGKWRLMGRQSVKLS